MTGGILQLAAYGAQDSFLTGNPQITFFKIVYRRYTNFAMEPIKIYPTGLTEPSLELESIWKFNIERNADLIFDTYLLLDMPAIFSDPAPDIQKILQSDETTDPFLNEAWEFKWVKYLGNAIIDNIKIFIGGALIDTQYGEWLTIWSELTMNEAQKKNYDEMIGNIDEFHSPEKTQGNITQFFNNQPVNGAFSWRDAPTGNAPGLPQKFVNNLYIDGLNDNPNPYRPGFRGDNLPDEYGSAAWKDSSGEFLYTPNICPQGWNDPRISTDSVYWYTKPGNKGAYPVGLGQRPKGYNYCPKSLYPKKFTHENCNFNSQDQIYNDNGEIYVKTNDWETEVPVESVCQPTFDFATKQDNTTLNEAVLRRQTIDQKTLYIPLFFWYCRNSGLAIPLIALQYNGIEIQVTLKPVYDWYTVLVKTPTNKVFTATPPSAPELAEYLPQTDKFDLANQNFPASPLIRTRANGYGSIVNHPIQNFLNLTTESLGLPENYSCEYSDTQTCDNDTMQGNVNVQQKPSPKLWAHNPCLLVNYIFLDDEERRRFALTSHEYLIEQVGTPSTADGLAGPGAIIDLNLQHPTKELIWIFNRSDSTDRNDHTNFTNWKNPEQPPWNAAWYNDDWGNYANGLNYPYPKIYKTNYQSYKKDIMIQARLLFNGQERMDFLGSDYYNKLQIYKYHTGKSLNGGIYVYSFALEPENNQPSGTCNFSRINSSQLQCDLLPPPSTNLNLDLNSAYDYQFSAHIYSVKYNILKIMAGMAGLTFAN